MFAIHSVFIIKENILFLEEWIDYHIKLGFDKFYLYDNSKVQLSEKNSLNKPCFVAGSVNKYGVNYKQQVKLSNNQIQILLNKIQKKYKCVYIIEWSPKNEKGVVLYEQAKAHNHCLKQLKRDKIQWCASIDMDEYIVIKNMNNIKRYVSKLLQKNKNISNINLKQILFDSRFTNMDKLVTNITDSCGFGVGACKNIFNVQKTRKLRIHEWFGVGDNYKATRSDIWFNHYKITNKEYKTEDNIHPTIKKQIQASSQKYLINKIQYI